MDGTEKLDYKTETINNESRMNSKSSELSSELQKQRSLTEKDRGKMFEKLEDRYSFCNVTKTTEKSQFVGQRIEKENNTISSMKRVLSNNAISRPSKKKLVKPVRRTTLTNDETRKLLGLLESGLPVRSVATALNVAPQVVSRIKKNKSDFSANDKTVDGSNPSTSIIKARSTGNSGLDSSLKQWYMQTRSLGIPVSNTDLKSKALVFNIFLNGPNSLRVNNLWLQKFKSRYRLDDSSFNDKILSVNDEQSQKFYEEFTEHLRKNGYTPERVYNAVETSITWKTLPDRFIDTYDDETRLSHSRVTIMICSNATGTHKLPLMVIGKEKNPRCFRTVKINPVIYKAQQDAWMDNKIFMEWYKEIFLPEIDRFHNDTTNKCILLLDNALPHRPMQSLNSISKKATVMYIPPSSTPLIQPLHQGIIQKIKKTYKMNLFRQVILDDGFQTPAILLKSLTMLFFCNYIASAWESVKKNDLMNAWRKIFPCEQVLESENEKLSTKNFFKMLRQIPKRGHVTTKEMDSWLADDENPGWKILNDDEILKSACNHIVDEIKTEIKEEAESIEHCTEMDDDQDFVPSASDALIGCNYVEGWIQSRPECTEEHLEVLRQVRQLALDASLAEKESFNEI